MPELESQYLSFETEPPKPPRKTTITYVVSKSSGGLLAEIRWHAPWRQYCAFFTGGTIFNWTCLAEINDYISLLMDERKA